MQTHFSSLVRRRSIYSSPISLIRRTSLRLSSNKTKPADSTDKTTPHEDFLAQMSKWSSHLTHDTFVDVHIPRHLPVQIQSSLLTSTIPNPTQARISISWPPEPPMQPEFLSQPLLNLKDFPPSASLIFLFWLFHRRLPHPPEPLEKQDQRTAQEHLNDTLTDSYLLGAALACPKFQDTVLRSLARALEKEERDAARSPVPHYSSAIPWARKTWEKSSVRGEEGRKLAEFAVDVAARRVYTVGVNGMVLTREERWELGGGGEEGFAGEMFASVGGQIGVKGVGIRELGRVGEIIEEMC